MGEYSKQLIAELSEHLDPDIIEFFEDTKTEYEYEVSTVNELIEYTLDKFFKGDSSKEDLRRAYEMVMKSRRQKKARWVSKLEIDTDQVPQDSPRYPFANLVGQKKFMDKALWRATYGSKTLDDLVSEHLALAKDWLSNSNSYFIGFPAINSKGRNAVFDSLISDTLVCIYKYIVEHYDGSIENYFLPLPKDLIGFPLFAPKKVRLTVSLEENKTLIDKYDFGSGVLETSASISSVSEQLRSMDQHDLMILTTSLQGLDLDFYTTRQARVKKAKLVKLLNNKPAKKHYELMEEHCHNLTRYNFTVKHEGKTKFSFNLMDNVNTSDPGEVVFTFGDLLYDSIVANNIANIKSSHMQLLNNNLSTILYYSLFKERLSLTSLHTNPDDDIYGDYQYSFFSQSVRFPSQTKKKNMDLVEESLKEFVVNHIIVRDYERISLLCFRIYFYPLSEEEKADLDFNRYNNVLTLN